MATILSTRQKPPADPYTPKMPWVTGPGPARPPLDPNAPTVPDETGKYPGGGYMGPPEGDPYAGQPDPWTGKIVDKVPDPKAPADLTDPRNANLNTPPAPTRYPSGASSDPMDMIERSAALHGNAVRPGDVDYWMAKYYEVGADNEYFWSLLMRDLNGGGGQSEGATSYPTLPPAFVGSPSLPSYGVGGVGSGGGYTASGTTGIGTTPEIDAAVRARILEMLTRKPPTLEELRATPEAAAYRLTSQRGHERDVAQLAEDAYVDNYSNTPEFEAVRRGLGANRGEAEARFMGELAMQRLQDQREDVQNAIVDAQNQSQFEAEQALKLQLAELDAAIRTLDIQQSAATAQRGQDITRELGLGGLANDRYGIDTTAATARRGQDVTKDLGMTGYAIDWARLDWDKEYFQKLVKAGLIPPGWTPPK